MHKPFASYTTFACLLLLLSAQAPPPINRPSIEAEQKSDGSIQYHQNSQPKAERRTPPLAEPPSLSASEHTTENSQEGGNEGTEFWPSFYGYRIKITDSLLVLFTAVLAYFTTGLHISTRRLWLDSIEQTRIQSETREIAVAALGRPYVFFEFVSHNFEDWREGKELLRFVFRFTNHGIRPAIVDSLKTAVFITFGRGAGDSGQTALIERYPEPNELYYFLQRPRPGMQASLGDAGEWADWRSDHALTIGPGETTQTFCAQYPFKPLSEEDRMEYQAFLYKTSGIGGSAFPYLIGTIRYAGPFGSLMKTAFTVMGHNDGTATQNDDAPYNERT